MLWRIIPLLKGAPYVPTSDERVRDLFKLIGDVKGKKIVELGSGDGKLVIALAKKGAVVDGFEINPLLVKKSQKWIEKEKLQKNAHVYLKNLWKVDVSKYDVAIVYGITYIMKDLEKKLQKEMKKGSQAISVYFQFPNWKPVKTLGEVRLYAR